MGTLERKSHGKKTTRGPAQNWQRMNSLKLNSILVKTKDLFFMSISGHLQPVHWINAHGNGLQSTLTHRSMRTLG